MLLSKPLVTLTSTLSFIPTPAPPPPPLFSVSIATCTKYETLTALDPNACNKLLFAGNLTLAEFRDLNPGVSEECLGLWVGSAYCIGGRIDEGEGSSVLFYGWFACLFEEGWLDIE